MRKGGLAIVRWATSDDSHQLQAIGISSRFLSGATDLLHLKISDVVRRNHVGDQPVRHFSSQGHHARPGSANVDGHVVTQRAETQPRVNPGEETSIVRESLPSKRLTDELDVFPQARERRLQRNAMSQIVPGMMAN